MNNVALAGRLTRDPDVRYTDGGSTIARFSIAVNRRFKTDNGPTADFISCVAFGKTAEFVEKYFFKGMKIDLTGRIQTGSYTNNEEMKVYTTDVVCESVEFGESKSSGQQSNSKGGFLPSDPGDGFMNVSDSIDEELPFK
ncbi:MAG: single-stranded DNA-binding protein [Lachnospiraceae bacterium]|nr:single-stranded DNA-binding protein [Lachnospiraceae bacterium]